MAKKPENEPTPAAKPAKTDKPATVQLRHSELNIYQKLAAITGAIGVVEKGGTNTEQKYAFIEYAAVAGKLRVLFAEYGVVIVPRMAKFADWNTEEITTKYGSKGINVRVPFEFEIVNADRPEDAFKVEWIGEAADYGDKATNKAATAALKYYLMRQFNISEKGDDPDQNTIDRGTVNADMQRQNPTPAAPAPQQPPKPSKISEGQLQKISEQLTKKGIKADDVEPMLKMLAKVDDTMDMSQATASAILQRIYKAEPKALQEYFYGATPAAAEPQQDPGDDVPTTTEPAAPAVAETPPLDVDDALKTHVAEKVAELELNGRGQMWLKREVTGKPYGDPQKWTDEQWRKCYQLLEDINDLKVDVPLDYLKAADTDTQADEPSMFPVAEQADLLTDDGEINPADAASDAGELDEENNISDNEA